MSTAQQLRTALVAMVTVAISGTVRARADTPAKRSPVVGAKAGAAYTSFDTNLDVVQDPSETPLVGSVGAFLQMQVNEKWSLRAELGLSKKGAALDLGMGPLGRGHTTFDLTYLELGVVAVTDLFEPIEYPSPRMSIHVYGLAGAAIGRLVRAQSESDSERTDAGDSFGSTDVALIGGIGARLVTGVGTFLVEGRYEVGLENVLASAYKDGDARIRNRSAVVMVGYVIGSIGG